MGNLVDLTQRRRWKSPATEPEKVREPPAKIATDGEQRDDLDSEAILAEMMRLAWTLRSRHGPSEELDARMLEAVLCK